MPKACRHASPVPKADEERARGGRIWVPTEDYKGQLDTDGWSWSALDLFDLLCPAIAGSRKLREDARYLLEADDNRKA